MGFFVIGKDVLGFFGTILTTIPFYTAWRAKKTAEEAEQPGAEGKVTLAAFEAIAAKYRNELFAPSRMELGLISGGFVLLCLSVIFSFIVSVSTGQ